MSSSTTSIDAASATSVAHAPGARVEVRGGADGLVERQEGSPGAAEQPRAWWRAAVPRHPWVWLAVFVMACGWDRAIYLGVASTAAEKIEAIERMELPFAVSGLFSWRAAEALDAAGYFAYFGVKFFGTVWVAAAIAAVIVLRSVVQADPARVRPALRRGTLVFVAPAAAGLVAEGLKLVFRRQRPEFGNGRYTFRFDDWLNASGLGLPSSHAAVAVAAGLVLAVVYPRWGFAWIALAGLCVLSRVLSGAHYTSDVVLGVLVGLAGARAVVALDLRNNRGVAVSDRVPPHCSLVTAP